MQCLLEHFINSRRLAYCLAGKDKRFISSGGDTVFYGLDTLKPGDSIDEALPFIEGTVFTNCGSIFIEHICFKPDSFANIHISSEEKGICVILLDVTHEVMRIKAMQQTGNELHLCRERLNRVEKKLKQALTRKTAVDPKYSD